MGKANSGNLMFVFIEREIHKTKKVQLYIHHLNLNKIFTNLMHWKIKAELVL